MTPLQILLWFAVLWLASVATGWLVVIPWLRRGPRGDATIGLLWRFVKIYCRVWHRATFSGILDRLPASDDDHDGLIVIANHTSAIDPLLVQAKCRFLIRWMMAEEMMTKSLDWLWRFDHVIPVARDGRDLAPLREAIRTVRNGGAVGIFPEGRITTPPGEIRPFLPGAGLLIAKTRAPVLLAWISGTPKTNLMGEALRTRSTSHVCFVDIIHFDDERDPNRIAEILRRRIAEASGWPLNEQMLPPGGPQAAA